MSYVANDTVDLVTVAQALHWYDMDRFNKEVKRVLKPGGVLAAYGYAVPMLDILQADDIVRKEVCA